MGDAAGGSRMGREEGTNCKVVYLGHSSWFWWMDSLYIFVDTLTGFPFSLPLWILQTHLDNKKVYTEESDFLIGAAIWWLFGTVQGKHPPSRPFWKRDEVTVSLLATSTVSTQCSVHENRHMLWCETLPFSHSLEVEMGKKGGGWHCHTITEGCALFTVSGYHLFCNNPCFKTLLASTLLSLLSSKKLRVA